MLKKIYDRAIAFEHQRIEEDVAPGHGDLPVPEVNGDCEVSAGAHLDPGVMLLDRTKLSTSEPGKPARVGEGARVGGGAVVCGDNTVGRDTIVAAGEMVEDDVPDGGVWMGSDRCPLG